MGKRRKPEGIVARLRAGWMAGARHDGGPRGAVHWGHGGDLTHAGAWSTAG